ncbi:MAG: hypothetical protein HY423_16575 [Candidatus Lambdaproteobacteria bacterium]|nr:hypothetical protein [Candidatus Lambdaproteobacteria bacterium]
MKITAVDCWLIGMPMKGTYKVAKRTKSVQAGVVVRVRTDEGLEGAGNVDPSPGYSKLLPEQSYRVVRDLLAPALLGRRAESVRALAARMLELAPDACEAHAAVEMALMDLNAKALDVPCHRLLGGTVRDTIALNGWIGIQPPGDAARQAKDYWDAGFRSVKVKVGEGVEADRDRVAAVREATPQMDIRVDGNEGFDVETAIRLGRAIARHNITLFEQPVPRADLDGMVRVRQAVDIPLMADEAVYDPATLVAVIKREAADIVKVKVMKQGGLIPTMQAIEMCRAAGIRCVIGHGFGLTLHTLAEMHVAAASDNLFEAIESVGPLKMTGDIVRDALPMQGGTLPVPQAPGLGATLDEAKVREYQVPEGG